MQAIFQVNNVKNYKKGRRFNIFSIATDSYIIFI